MKKNKYININMVLNKQFKNAKIEKKNNVYVLTITYSWYYLIDYNEVFVEPTLKDAQLKLLKERSNNNLFLYEDGKETKDLT